MNTTTAQPSYKAGDKADDLLRLLSVAFRRYSREPGTRVHSGRMMLLSALALYAEQTSPGEAALTAAEGLADLAAQERKRGAR